MTTGADIDTDELVDETGVDPKDIELVTLQVRPTPPRSRNQPPTSTCFFFRIKFVFLQYFHVDHGFSMLFGIGVAVGP